VIDFVLWSFVIALTPVALGLAWKLIRMGHWIGLGLSYARAHAGFHLNPAREVGVSGSFRQARPLPW
jgi:hypothetical protein